MQNAINHTLKDFVPKKTIHFVDDIPIKGYKEGINYLTMDDDGCTIFIKNHFKDVRKILKKLSKGDLTLAIEKSKFGVDKIVVVGHLYQSHVGNPILRK